MAVWLLNVVCQRRHCAYGVAREGEFERVELDELLDSAAHHLNLNPWCGICGGDLHREYGRTRFATMEEALPALVVFQAQQMMTRATLDALGLTVEKLFPDGTTEP